MALRDYVGLINQTYHPGIVSIFEKTKESLEKQGDTDAVKVIDIFLSGAFGSGFLYNDARGNLYIITNNHVISQAHTLSITFERQDGTKRKIENLRIVAVDEENDLALLAIPAGGTRPFTAQGLTLLNRAAIEGEDVFSAGFPGLGATAIWQFGRGMVSNSNARIPKNILDETLMGPFIQHTAQVDSGNSGGPLLVQQGGAPSGYAVVGINTLKAYNRQAANYAIPMSTVRAFINESLNPKPELYRTELDQRLEKFTEGLGVNRAVYPHIAEFLSTECIGENAEYAIEEMYDKGNRTVRRAFVEKLEDSVAGAMGYAVAWTIENSMRAGGTSINASIKDVIGAGDEYAVIFTINNKDVTSKWVREYGNWRIRTFGTVAEGNKELLSKKREKKERDSKLRLDNDFYIEAGYAYLFDRYPSSNGIYASITYTYLTANFLYIDSDYWDFGFGFTFDHGFAAGNIGLIPHIDFGFNYHKMPSLKDSDDFGFPLSAFVQPGIRITSSYVSGLYLGADFRYMVMNLSDRKYKTNERIALIFTVGYTF